jgi:hypothetical protein
MDLYSVYARPVGSVGSLVFILDMLAQFNF